MNEECRNVIGDTIREIIERADEANMEWKSDRSNKVAYGRLFALCEVLSIIKTDFVGIEEVEKLLDFDIDKRYICSQPMRSDDGRRIAAGQGRET